MQWLVDHWVALVGFLYILLNEVVALAPNLQSNSIVQLVLNILKSVVPKSPPAP